MYNAKMKPSECNMDKEMKLTKQKIQLTKCQCCAGSPYTDNFGEWHNGKWWCYDHVEILFAREGVSDLYELIEKRGGDR